MLFFFLRYVGKKHKIILIKLVGDIAIWKGPIRTLTD